MSGDHGLLAHTGFLILEILPSPWKSPPPSIPGQLRTGTPWQDLGVAGWWCPGSGENSCLS